MTPPEFPERFNMARYFLDDRLTEGRGERVAVIDDTGAYTYREVAERAEQVARMLWERGVRPEDRVLIGLRDSVEFAAAFFGILKAGAVVTMVNPELPETDYDYYFGYTRARACLVEADLWARIHKLVAPHRSLCHTVLTVRGAGHPANEAAGEALPWTETVDRARPGFGTYDTSKDDPSAWLFTSGSTGKPKAAVHLHHDFPYNTECYAKGVLGMGPADVTLAVSKLFFGYATGSNLMFPLAVGGTAVLFRDKATPERLCELAGRHRATVLVSVPTMINKMAQLLAAEPGRRQALATLRACISAGEALPEELYRRWKDLTGVEILDGIGSAELFHIYITNRPGDVVPGSLGRVVPGYQARLVGPDGNDVPDGEIGTLWVRGDSAAICYWQAHEKSKEVLRGDWVVSGDLFRRDAEGRFYYVGRADDLLKVGGIFVSPLEVEEVLLTHPAVLEVAVVGYEDEDRLVKAMAYVVLRPAATPGEALAEELIQHARGRLAHYKAPRRIEFVPALPRSDRGKVLRRVLRGNA